MLMERWLHNQRPGETGIDFFDVLDADEGGNPVWRAVD